MKEFKTWTKNPFVYALSLLLIFGVGKLAKNFGAYAIQNYTPAGKNSSMSKILQHEGANIGSHARKYKQGFEAMMPFFMDRSGSWLDEKGKDAELNSALMSARNAALEMHQYSIDRAKIFDGFKSNDSSIAQLALLHSKIYHYYIDLSDIMAEMTEILGYIRRVKRPSKRHPININEIKVKYALQCDDGQVNDILFKRYLSKLDEYIKLESEMVAFSEKCQDDSWLRKTKGK